MVRENSTTFYMNMSNTGYKAMLRDRIPLVANLALLWTNSKTAWVNHVYKHFISIYADNEERKNATRILLGLKKNFKPFNFHSTIDWDNLNDESTKNYERTKHWKFVENWVEWFAKNYAYLENAYVTDITSGYDKEEAKLRLKQNYLDFFEESWECEEMANLLINHFNYDQFPYIFKNAIDVQIIVSQCIKFRDQ